MKIRRMLRQIKYITISALLLISTTGFSVSKHYCNGELVSISINESAESCCDGNDDCCRNEDELLILKANFSMPLAVVINISEFTLFVTKTIVPFHSSISNNFNIDIEINLKPPLEINVFLAKIQSYIL